MQINEVENKHNTTCEAHKEVNLN